ncbi:MAG TPA: pantoate--beta-alanine ligase [Bacteroidales bacterium]|nr:pantoate--beta-alanine ligase [Bacteroidales bacterium]
MLVFERKNELVAFVRNAKDQGKTIGFVPTMGALHAGHLSLVKISVEQCDMTIASIFVNPIQFNNPKDLEKYPRTFDADSKMLEEAGCDIIFHPSIEEMYPTEAVEKFDFGQLETVMEGAFRPGHFNGVAVVVKRLFEIVNPDKAYFGKKDFQQLAIVKALVKQIQFPVEIIGMETVREPDGLAMSSRNIRLSPDERIKAVEISKVLKFILENKSQYSPLLLEAQAIDRLSKNFKVEYIQIVDGDSLQPISSWNQTDYPVVCAAAFLGEVRLIDNLELE